MTRLPRMWDRSSVDRSHGSATYAVEQVFGLSRELPLNYVQRDGVDDEFYKAMVKEKHLVVFGSSKQGKTSLIRQSLAEDTYVRISCQHAWSLSALHTAILKQSGYTVEQSLSKTVSGEYKVNVKYAGSIKPAGAELAVGVERLTTDGVQLQSIEHRLELDAGDVNDVILALKDLSCDKSVVLEDFHYLDHKTQRRFSQSLKAFYDDSWVKFIIVGVWLDPNRLSHYNRDLAGRVTTISADIWTREQLHLVITQGERLLNIRFDEGFTRQLLDSCFNSVWIVQEVCYLACLEAGVQTSQPSMRKIGTSQIADHLITKVIDSQSVQYLHFIKAFIQNADASARDIYRWLLAIILVADPARLEEGVHLHEMHDFIVESDREEFISESSIEYFLGNHLSWYQINKLHLNPIILDFDRTRKCVTVTDRGFLIWLDSRDRDSLLDDADVPRQVIALRHSRASRRSRRSGRHRA